MSNGGKTIKISVDDSTAFYDNVNNYSVANVHDKYTIIFNSAYARYDIRYVLVVK